MGKPAIYIMPEAKIRLDLYGQEAKGEISGLGEIEVVDNSIIVTAIHLYRQKTTFSDTRLDPEALSNALIEIVDSGGDPNRFKLWWHFHPGNQQGSLFWSGEDENTIAKFGTDWLVSIVGNRGGEYRGRIDLFRPFRVTLDELHLQLLYVPDENTRREIAAEVKAKVTFLRPKKFKKAVVGFRPPTPALQILPPIWAMFDEVEDDEVGDA